MVFLIDLIKERFFKNHTKYKTSYLERHNKFVLKEDITKNADGTVTVKTNKFKMPDADVTIEASFVKEDSIVPASIQNMTNKVSNTINPKTGDGVVKYFILIIACEIIGIFLVIKHKKLKKKGSEK